MDQSQTSADATLGTWNGHAPRRILVFGEVLFDHFPDGNRVLGGAPFKVAWNLRGLGYAMGPSGTAFAGPPEPARFQDAVGAGDAFSAAAIAGLLRGLTLQEVLDSAVSLASRVCSITGATSNDESLYQEVFS